MKAKWYLIGGSVLALVVAVVIVFSLSNCGLGHSKLLQEENTNDCCKMFLECAYYLQKDDKSGCTPFATCCKNMIVYERCKNQATREPNETIDQCMNRLKTQ